MNMVTFFLARRILFAHVNPKSISTVTIICFIGIFIGSLSLALITAIMNGFEVTIHKKIQGIHSDIIIQSYQNDINVNVLGKVIHKEFPEIIAFSPIATHHVLLRTHDELNDAPIVAMIKGIDPEREQMTSSLSKKINFNSPHQKFSQLLNNDQILIGKQLAYNNELFVNDSIELLFIRDEQMKGRKITLDSYTTTISGIFETGIDEFDNGVIYCSLSLFEKIFPNIGIKQVNIAISPTSNEKIVIQKLHKRLGLNVYSWKDLYPSLVATLKLEKYVSFFILFLILLVASMNIISLLFMQIIQKKSNIALLRAMGMSHNAVSSIFFIMGITISVIASFFGLMSALIISIILKKYPFISLPDTYYVTQLPVAMTIEIITAVFCTVILLGACATWLPTRRIRIINISHILRFEG